MGNCAPKWRCWERWFASKEGKKDRRKTHWGDPGGYELPPNDREHDLLLFDSVEDLDAYNRAKIEYALRFSIEYQQMYFWKWVALVVVIPVLIVLYGVWIVKGHSDTPDAYAHYFTNWMWTINVFFYTLLLLSFLDRTGILQFILLFVIWWPVFGNINQVFFLVLLLIWLNPQIIVEAGERYGWPVTLEVERLVHVNPWGLIWLITILMHWCLSDVLKRFDATTKSGRKMLLCYVLLNILNANLIIIGYILTFDFKRVYHVDLPLWIAIILIEVIYVLVIGGAILMLSPVGQYLGKRAYTVSTKTMPGVLRLTRKDDKQLDDPIGQEILGQILSL